MTATARMGIKRAVIGLTVVVWDVPALPPKVDIAKRRWDVCFVPKADILRRSNRGSCYCKNWRIFASSWRGLKGFGT
jgi:hypothetical protein